MARINLPDIEDSLHRDLKATAAQDGKTIRDFVLEAIREHIERTKRARSGRE